MRQGRPWYGSNLLRVCGAGNASGCHGWIETHPVHATTLGLIVSRGQDPHAVPMFCNPVLFHLGWWRPDDEGMWHAFTVVAGRRVVGAAERALLSHLDAIADAL